MPWLSRKRGRGWDGYIDPAGVCPPVSQSEGPGTSVVVLVVILVIDVGLEKLLGLLIVPNDACRARVSEMDGPRIVRGWLG
jgi:hypothetical protein